MNQVPPTMGTPAGSGIPVSSYPVSLTIEETHTINRGGGIPVVGIAGSRNPA